jgi:filamentous hemagglutinin
MSERTTLSDLEREEIGIASQLTLETPTGKRTRMDFVTRDPTSDQIRCIECKASETARLTARQRETFPEIETSGATVKGAGKPGFPGGTVLPPTNVEIIRKR